ncbi:unnamed protein product, partial [Ascophyllum nodosum]
MEHPPPRPRLQRSASERPAPLRRSSSLFGALGRVPWSTNDDDHFSSSGDDEPPPAPPSPSLSAEEAKASKRAARKQKIKRLFKQGVSKVMKQRAEEMDRMAKKAALYVMDAFAGRLKHGMAEISTKSPYVFTAFRVQISWVWMWTIIVCSVAHSLMVFLEPRPGRGGEDGYLDPGTLRLIEATFIAVYALDVALKASYMGLKTYLKKPWQKLMILITLILAVDATGLVGVRFARALRPAILSLRTRPFRRFYAVVSNMLPGFLRVCLPVLFFLLLSASYAALAFGRAKQDFEDPTAAGYAIWILMVCADNYETLVNEPSRHPVYVPFVVMIIVVGSMFLLSLLLGVTYDVFIEHTTEQVKSERLKELKGLNMAFATLDPAGTGKISMVVWDRFLLHLMPRTTKQERALYFEIASGFAENLDVLGFMDLRQVLGYSFVNVNAIERAEKRQKLEKLPTCLMWLLRRMEAALRSRAWRHVLAVVVLTDCLCLPNSIPHQGPGLVIRGITAACGAILLVDQAFQMAGWVRTGWSGPGPLRLPGKSVHIKARRDDSIAAIAGVGVLLHTMVVAVLHCPPVLSLCCHGLSLVRNVPIPQELDGGSVFGGWGDVGGTNQGMEAWAPGMEGEPGVCVVGGGISGLWGGSSRFFDGGVCSEVDWCTDSVLMLAYTLRLLRCWRLVTLNDTLHDHVNTFFSVVPVFAQTLSFALIMAYFFAMVAMQAFADKATAFRDAGMSLRTTLQLFVGVDFSAVVQNTVDEVGPAAMLFFVAYHVVGVLIVFNLLTAIMIQLYGEALNEKSRKGMEEQRRVDQELQDHLYEFNQKQRVLRLWGRRVTQGASSLNITRETKVSSGREARRMLGAGSKSHMPTAEELKQCQKHAKVDLLRALRERTRGGNNLRTFERSLYQKLKSSDGGDSLNYQSFADGHTIFARGDRPSTCFFVHKGVVRLESIDGTVETKEKGEMFGEEALVCNLATGATAVAEGTVECVGIDRETFTETYGTLENLGLIFLRLQRSRSLFSLEHPMSDGSRRSDFSSVSARSTSARTPFSMGTSQLDFSASDLQFPEKWRHWRNSVPTGRGIKVGASNTTGEGSSGGAGGGASESGVKG